MKRFIMVFTGVVSMASVIMFGTAVVSSAQQQPATSGIPPGTPMAHHEIYEGMQPGALQSGTPPTGIGSQFNGPGVTYFIGNTFPATEAPGGPTGIPPGTPMAHHEIYEGMQPGALQSDTPPTGMGSQFKGPGVTYFIGNSFPATEAPGGPTGIPPGTPMAHHEIYEGMQPGALQSGTPPTGIGSQFKGPGVTYFIGNTFPAAGVTQQQAPATQAPAK